MISSGADNKSIAFYIIISDFFPCSQSKHCRRKREALKSLRLPFVVNEVWLPLEKNWNHVSVVAWRAGGDVPLLRHFDESQPKRKTQLRRSTSDWLEEGGGEAADVPIWNFRFSSFQLRNSVCCENNISRRNLNASGIETITHEQLATPSLVRYHQNESRNRKTFH